MLHINVTFFISHGQQNGRKLSIRLQSSEFAAAADGDDDDVHL